MERQRSVVTNRLKKRITVRFGEEEAEKLAFTEDVSRTGIFIKTTQIVHPGRDLKVAFELDQGIVKMEGKVVWAKKVPPSMIRMVKKCGMGIRITGFEEGEERYLSLFPEGR